MLAASLPKDTGTYGNLVELAHLQHLVAKQLEQHVGNLIIHAKSAHIYDQEWEYMQQLLSSAKVKG